MIIRTTHTYALMDVSAETYAEIRRKLEEAGYQHAIMEDGVLDMHGIGIGTEADTIAELLKQAGDK